MKKQYLIIGLAGLMASNAVSTTYGNRELDDYLAKCGFPQDSSLEKPGFYARHSTLIKTTGGVALAGALGFMCYKLNQSGKLSPDAVKAGLKSLVSKAGDLKSSVGTKISNLFSRSSTPVNNTLVNQTMPNATRIDMNKSQKLVWNESDFKPVFDQKSVVVPVENKSMGARFGSWFSRSSKPVETCTFVPSLENTKKIGSEKLPVSKETLENLVRTEEKVLLLPAPPKATVETKTLGSRLGSLFSRFSKISKPAETCAPISKKVNIYGYFVPNAENPKTFIMTKPSVDVQKGSSAFDTYVKNHFEVFNAAKKNIVDTFANNHNEVAHEIKQNITSFFSKIFRK